MSNKTRLDVLLVERGLEQTRQRAQAMIMSGLVFVDGQRVDKAGTAVPNDAQIEVRGNTLRYVSRGGLKLEKAMTTFGLKLDGCICADIGASTGGFTDCMRKTARQRSTPSTSATDSSIGSSAPTSALCAWNARTRAISTATRFLTSWILPASTCRLFR